MAGTSVQVAVEIVTSATMMTIEEFWLLAEKEIWPLNHKRSNARKVCDSCAENAKGYRDPQNRPGHSGKAPVLPVDFDKICPEYGGRCPRCGGILRNGGAF